MKKVKVTYIASDRDGADIYENVTTIEVADSVATELTDNNDNVYKYRLSILVEKLAELQTDDFFARATIETVEVVE